MDKSKEVVNIKYEVVQDVTLKDERMKKVRVLRVGTFLVCGRITRMRKRSMLAEEGYKFHHH